MERMLIHCSERRCIPRCKSYYFVKLYDIRAGPGPARDNIIRFDNIAMPTCLVCRCMCFLSMIIE